MFFRSKFITEFLSLLFLSTNSVILQGWLHLQREGLCRRDPPCIPLPEDGVGTGRAVKVNASLLNSSQKTDAWMQGFGSCEPLGFSQVLPRSSAAWPGKDCLNCTRMSIAIKGTVIFELMLLLLFHFCVCSQADEGRGEASSLPGHFMPLFLIFLAWTLYLFVVGTWCIRKMRFCLKTPGNDN